MNRGVTQVQSNSFINYLMLGRSSVVARFADGTRTFSMVKT